MSDVKVVLPTTALAVAVIASGFWLGAFAWFGGYAWVKDAFGWAALAAGCAAAALFWFAYPRRWPFSFGIFVGFLLLYWAAVAAGQTFYFSPSGAVEAAQLFKAAMTGAL